MTKNKTCLQNASNISKIAKRDTEVHWAYATVSEVAKKGPGK